VKIAYVTRQYPELSETFVTEELRALRELGHDPFVFAPYRGNGELGGAPAARYLADFATRDRVAGLARLASRRPIGLARAILDPAGRFGEPAIEMASFAALAGPASRARHIHAHFATDPTTLAARLSALSGVPFSFTAHAYDIFIQWDRLEEKLERAAFAVTISEYNRRYISERVPEHAASKLHVLRCGVDLERFRRTRPYDPSGPVVAVGRLVEKKGFEQLVRAAALLPGSARPEVLIAGDGPQRELLERLISELDAPVRLLGALGHDEVRSLYEGASALAMPCVVATDGDRDGLPIVVKEAMALELPVIGTTEVALPEEVGPDRGVLVPPRDVDALAEGLARLWEMPGRERVEMGHAGRAFAEAELDLRKQTEKLVALFESAR
jgi:colanic acid/amylovoran biosynthesis glycosyltransferase